ncbi:hypothetical protein [Desulfohalovibrio reitneri]|uniref:hypothetical protein n=1 Tax=Desulfohalovibrio reitneri TaxID=1307759 RepID=UPI00110DD5D5|nr:hypothetical protein [Desulfohalovibrio reitneri]
MQHSGFSQGVVEAAKQVLAESPEFVRKLRDAQLFLERGRPKMTLSRESLSPEFVAKLMLLARDAKGTSSG